eukprot:m.36091 g.36091  ORF g.36091 m.36091 type:complete len:67 (+) comp9961_c0_seq2:2054-2254(+)
MNCFHNIADCHGGVATVISAYCKDDVGVEVVSQSQQPSKSQALLSEKVTDFSSVFFGFFFFIRHCS